MNFVLQWRVFCSPSTGCVLLLESALGTSCVPVHEQFENCQRRIELPHVDLKELDEHTFREEFNELFCNI